VGVAEKDSTGDSMPELKEVVEISPIKKEMKFEIPVEIVRQELDKVSKEIAGHASIPGFRHGKAPLNLVRKRYAKEIEAHMLGEYLPEYVEHTVKEQPFKVLGSPKLSDVHFHENEPLRFTVAVEVDPALELKEYRGIEIPEEKPEPVTEAWVSDQIEALREKTAEFLPLPERPLKEGDYILVDMTTREEGKPPSVREGVLLQIGSEQNPKEFNARLLDLRFREPVEFTVQPDAPEEAGEANPAPVHYTVTLNELKEKKLADLDDDFAKSLGNYESLEKLRESIHSELERRVAERVKQRKVAHLKEAVLSAHDFEIPDFYVEEQQKDFIETLATQMVVHGADIESPDIRWDEIKKEHRDSAVKDARWYFVLDRIAEKENLIPTKEDVEKKLESIAREMNKSIDYVTARFDKEGRKERLVKDLQRQAAIDFLLNHATIKASEVNP
jgi:trigger factor